MGHLVLIFDQSSTYLGEMSTREGAFGRFVLSRDGEAQLGETIESWQTEGIVVLTHKPHASDTHGELVVVDRRIQPRSPEFLEAFLRWCALHRLTTLIVPEHLVTCWEKLAHLPLHPVERQVMMTALCRVPEADVSGWMTALDDARVAVAEV